MLELAFMAVNLLDTWLTGKAMQLGLSELNPVAFHMGWADNLWARGLLALGIILVLRGLKKEWLLKPLCVVLVLICAWNAHACFLVRIGEWVSTVSLPVY